MPKLKQKKIVKGETKMVNFVKLKLQIFNFKLSSNNDWATKRRVKEVGKYRAPYVSKVIFCWYLYLYMW